MNDTEKVCECRHILYYHFWDKEVKPVRDRLTRDPKCSYSGCGCKEFKEQS